MPGLPPFARKKYDYWFSGPIHTLSENKSVRVIESYRHWRKERVDAKIAALHHLGGCAFDFPSLLLIRPEDASAKKFKQRIKEIRGLYYADSDSEEIMTISLLLLSEVRAFADKQRSEVDSIICELTDSLEDLLQNLSSAVDDTRTRADEIGEIRSCLTEAEGAKSLEDAKKMISAGLTGIQHLVENEIDRQKQLRTSHERYNDQLRQKLNRAEMESRTDPLTGIANRNGIAKHLLSVADHARTNGSRHTVAMADLDRFKEVNDVLGHQAGDAALVAFVQRLQSAVGEGVFVGRLGGDEFLVVTPADPELLIRMLFRLNEQLKQRPIVYDGVALELTCSYGIEVLTPGVKPDQILKSADAKLYEHKRRFKNLRSA